MGLGLACAGPTTGHPKEHNVVNHRVALYTMGGAQLKWRVRHVTESSLFTTLEPPVVLISVLSTKQKRIIRWASLSSRIFRRIYKNLPTILQEVYTKSLIGL